MTKHPKPTVHGRDHASDGPDPIPGDRVFPYSVSGVLAVAAGGLRWYAEADGTVTNVHASVGTPPTGSSLVVQVNRNGSSIATVTIADGNHTATTAPTPQAYQAGDYFTVDVTSVGSTTAGSDLVVQLRG